MLTIGLIIGLIAGAMLARHKAPGATAQPAGRAAVPPEPAGNCPCCAQPLRRHSATVCDSCGSLLARCANCAESNTPEATACRCCGTAFGSALVV